MSPVAYVSEPFTLLGGGIVVGALVEVRQDGTAIKAPIYYDTVGTPAPNPLRTNNSGLISFYAEPGEYDLYSRGLTFPIEITGEPDPLGGDEIVLAFWSSEPTVGIGKSKQFNDSGRSRRIVAVRASADVNSGQLTVDVKVNGSSLWSLPAGRPAIAAPGGSVKATNMTTTEVADGQYFTCDVTEGSGTNLVVQIVLK